MTETAHVPGYVLSFENGERLEMEFYAGRLDAVREPLAARLYDVVEQGRRCRFWVGLGEGAPELQTRPISFEAVESAPASLLRVSYFADQGGLVGIEVAELFDLPVRGGLAALEAILRRAFAQGHVAHFELV